MQAIYRPGQILRDKLDVMCFKLDNDFVARGIAHEHKNDLYRYTTLLTSRSTSSMIQALEDLWT